MGVRLIIQLMFYSILSRARWIVSSTNLPSKEEEKNVNTFFTAIDSLVSNALEQSLV